MSEDSRAALVIDGYNVLRSVEPYRRAARTDMESARARLAGDVAAYSGGAFETYLVFDGGANRHSDGSVHELAGIKVIFSEFGVDADTVIEDLVQTYRHEGRRITLVTSDAQTQWAGIGPGVRRMSAAEFAEELAGNDVEWREHNPAGSKKGTLDARIDPVTRDVLESWARGSK